MSVHQRESIYDKLRPHLDSLDLIRRLGIEMTRSIGSEAYCKPLCHESTSGESLHVNIHSGRWMCRACQPSGVYGDLFQLVEYALSGGAPPSRGNAQGASQGHLDAITWLCDQFGIPFDDERVTGDEGLDVVHLFAMAAHEFLLTAPKVLAWIQDKWGFDRETVEAYGIGYMPDPLLPMIMSEATRATSRKAFRSSGLGWYQRDGGLWRTRFGGRVLFPYLESGRAIYLIGRATPWTPLIKDGERTRKPPKYHKLSVHSEKRPYISARITNDHLYNEPVMRSASEIGVVEGVADAVAIASLGVSVVSPVTISFNATDLKRFIRKCHENNISRVWILFDNELSGSGNWAARRTALKLVEGGLTVDILTLPLGPTQLAALQEVVDLLGEEAFKDLERLDPNERKKMVERLVPDSSKRAWLIEQIAATKIDAAEWCAAQGAGAPHGFNKIRKAGVDVIQIEVDDVAARVDEDAQSVIERAAMFDEVVDLAAHVEERLSRDSYASMIAKAAGKGVTKAEITRRIAAARRLIVKPKRDDAKQKESSESKADMKQELVLLPPEVGHTQPPAPPEPPKPKSDSSKPAAPAAPQPKVVSDHERYEPARIAVAKGVDEKWPEESLGSYVAQTITRSMGFTPFRTVDELYLVRGNKRIAVGLERASSLFTDLLWLASGLTIKKNSHRAYIAAAIYFLGKDARRVEEVSWSFVSGGTVYFPTGDVAGHILAISSDGVIQTKMSDVRVPAVTGEDFSPFTYVEERGGIADVIESFRWTSISAGDRLILIHWLVCLPILRLRGTVPIVRIEGGSSSGKTRTVDAVSFLVNGKKSASVPTAPALASRMSTEMLTIDDNRETGDVSSDFLGTLLQATHLGAREKRRNNSDTGTVIERICGALLMNGIEPIHDGRSELASRILTLRCAEKYRASDSPTSESELSNRLLNQRNAFWSEASRRCSAALKLDEVYGESIGVQIEQLFGETRIGRLSSYLRVMYLAWVAGLPDANQGQALESINEGWSNAFSSLASGALESLLAEELAVSALRYVFAYGIAIAEPVRQGADEHRAFAGKFVMDVAKGDAYLGPLRATQLARLARAAGKELNAPRAVTTELRAGQLESRLLDGLAYLRAAGFAVEVETTAKGRIRFTFCQQGVAPSPGEAGESEDGFWQP